MNNSKVASKLRGKIAQFSGELSRGLGKTAHRFISEIVYGIHANGSVLITKIARALDEGIHIKETHDRLIYQLGKAFRREKITENLLKLASSKVKEDTLLVLDLSDIQKEHAKKMEYLAPVRDGDKKVIGKGYWTCNVIGTELDNEAILPLYMSLYSADAPGFVSENEEIMKAINVVSKHCKGRGIWVIDRGGDRRRIFEPLLDAGHRFLVRLRGDRNLIYKGKEVLASRIAESCPCRYAETIVKEEGDKERSYRLSFGYRRVKLPGRSEQLWLLVIRGFGNAPMMILTNNPLRRNHKVLYNMVNAYIKRWSIEETIRFVKQQYDLENIRILRYESLRYMMSLVLAAVYFAAVVLDPESKMRILTHYVLESAKRLFGIPDFRYYSVSDGLNAIFTRNPGMITPHLNKNRRSWQLAIKFT